MATIVSTSTRTIDINALFDHPDASQAQTALQALTGKFSQRLIDTPDYTLSLLTFVGYTGDDGISDGVMYELYLVKDDKTRKFSFPSEVVEYLQAYMTTTQQVTRVNIDTAKLAGRYTLLKGPMNGRKNIQLNGVDVIVREVKGFNTQRDNDATLVGFVKNDDVMTLAPVMKEYGISIG